MLSLHIAGMYGLAPVAGWAADRVGPRAVILAGAALLATAAALSGTAGHDHTQLAAGLACARLYGTDLAGTNLVRRLLTDPAAAQAIVNWPDVAWAVLDRLRHQRNRAPSDQYLADLVTLAETALAGVPRPSAPAPDPVLCPWFRIGDRIIKTIGIAARFDSTAEITLDELRIELAYPLDDTAEEFFREP